ncbi:hypothetical protein I4U23_019902 [Adineta vaga]|nr:hypothetical protein I4U23_019902 [Adineta vaga]
MTLIILLITKIILIRGNLLSNGNFIQIQTNGQPSNWDSSIKQGNASMKILYRYYLAFNVLQISVYTNRTLFSLIQMIQLEQNTNKRSLIISFWYRVSMIYSSGHIQFEFYNQSNVSITKEYIRSLVKNSTWSYVQIKKSIPIDAIFGKVLITMNRCLGKVLLANMSIEQIDHWNDVNFFVSPRSDGTLFIRWNFTNNKTHIAHYDVYRSKGISTGLDSTHLLVSIPVMSTYGKNIYESMYTDHIVQLNTIYTYQVIARNSNRTILDQTRLAIGQSDLIEDYYDITTLIAFLRINSIHLNWRLRARSTAKYISLYNGIDNISNIHSTHARLLGTYAVQQMKTIVSSSNTGPFLLISDDGNHMATAKLTYLMRPRIVLTSTRLNYFREQISQSGHAQEVFRALIKTVHGYKPDNTFNYCWPARDAALLYAITRNMKYIDIALLALEINRINYTIYDNSAIKLRFAFSTMARVQAFDWAYDGLTIEQRRRLISDFRYAASIFTSYSDDHSRNPTDKASNWVAIVKSAELIQHLTLYGEEDYPNDQAERRILFLLNELKLHIDHAYGPSGYMQEGLSYLAYTISALAPAVYLTKDMGISTFDEAWFRPDWHNLALHTISLRKQRNALQFGVSQSSYSYNGFLPYIFNSTDDQNSKAALKWFYDRTMGMNSSSAAYDGKDKSAALFYYPYETSLQHPSIVFPRSTSMISDNIEGFYVFRNRYQDQNDVLIALMNRNRRHAGWNANETFALSIISHDTTWARMPGKEFKLHSQTNMFSTPLIDGWPREPGKRQKLAFTKLVKPFSNQGGGFVSLDASINFNITLAQRDILVDMIKRNNIETIIALQDDFVDSLTHVWHWQLSPNPDETNITLRYENNLSTFIIRGRNESWLKGWLYNHEDATYNNTDGILRILKYGFNANFKIVMVLGSGIESIASRTINGIQIDKVCINFNTLSEGLQCQTITPVDITRRSILILIILTTLIGFFTLVILGILMKRIINRNNRVGSTIQTDIINVNNLTSISKTSIPNQTIYSTHSRF